MQYLAERAKQYAIKAHGSQQYGELPYSYHLQRVSEIIREYHQHFDETHFDYIVAAAWLHDVVEDTPVTFEDVRDEFGSKIARTVLAVTNQPGKNRRERATHTYPKIMAAGRDAVAVKLADRIANTEHSLKHNHRMFSMYRKEYPKFRKALRIPGELKKMWARLDVMMDTKLEGE